MAKTRRAYTGGAVSTTTTSSIAASGVTSFTITAGTGWPYGSDPFYVVVEPGTASEEKILVTRTGVSDLTINVASDSVRGLDGTAAVSHGSGVTVFPVFTAVDADEANELASRWSAKGDLVSYGSSTFEKLGVGADDTVLIADSGEASGLKWGAVTAAQLATGANKLGSGSAVRTLGTFVGGDTLQAAELNAIGTWESWTPTITPQSGTFTTVTVDWARYTIINKVFLAQVRFALTSIGSGAGIILVTLPSGVDIGTNGKVSGSWREQSVNGLTGIYQRQSATQVGLHRYDNGAVSVTNGSYSGSFFWEMT